MSSKSDIPNLDIVPSHIDLVGAEIEMINYPNREGGIERPARTGQERLRLYRYRLLALAGLITVNALTAADSVIVPVQPNSFALEGLGKLLNTIKIVQSRLNQELVIERHTHDHVRRPLRLCNQVVSEVRKHFDEMVFNTILHRNSKISEAPIVGNPLSCTMPSAKAP